MLLLLSFSAACSELPEVCDLQNRVARISEEAKHLYSEGHRMTPQEREVRLAELQRELDALDRVLAQLDRLLNENDRLLALKCTASCPNGSCSCWLCSCGCTANGNPWCGGGGGGDAQSLNASESVIPSSSSHIVAIYDVSGRKVREGRWMRGRLPSLRPGVYFLKYDDGKVRKVVIR